MVCHRANPPHCHLFLLWTWNKPHGLTDENKGSICTFGLVNAVSSLSWVRNGILPEYIPLHQAAWSFLPNLGSTCKVPASLVFPASPLVGSPLRSPRQPQAVSSAQARAALGSAGTSSVEGRLSPKPPATRCWEPAEARPYPTWNTLASWGRPHEGFEDAELESWQGGRCAEPGFSLSHRERGQLSTGSYRVTARSWDMERGKAWGETERQGSSTLVLWADASRFLKGFIYISKK